MPEQIHGASLDLSEAGELAEMLTFCRDWLAGPDHDRWPPHCAASSAPAATSCPRSRATWPGSLSCSATTASHSSLATRS